MRVDRSVSLKKTALWLAVLLLLLVLVVLLLPKRLGLQEQASVEYLHEYESEAASWLQQLLELEPTEAAPFTLEKRRELRRLLVNQSLAGEDRAALMFWAVVRRIWIPEDTLQALYNDENFLARADDRWLFTTARLALFYAHPYTPEPHSYRDLSFGAEALQRARELNPQPAVYPLYHGAILHYQRQLARREGDEASAHRLLGELIEAVEGFNEATEMRMLLPPPYLDFASSVVEMPPVLRYGERGDLPLGMGLQFALLIASDLREKLRRQPSAGSLERLLRFYRQLFSLQPPSEATFDSTAYELVDFLSSELPQAMPELAPELATETKLLTNLAEELQDVTRYAEANPIYTFTDIALYHEQRRLAFRGDFKAAIDSILRKLEN